MLRKVPMEFGAVVMVVAAVVYGALVYWAATASTALAWTILSLVTVAVAVAAGLIYAKRHRHPGRTDAPLRAAPTPDDGVYRVLLVVDSSGTLSALPEQVAHSAGGRQTQAFVVAPALSSRLGRWTGDEGAYEDASGRLDATVAALTASGVEARGQIGSHDPLQAAADGLREFPADVVVFATHADGEANWLEEGVVEAARSRSNVPVEHVRVGAD
jgi:hypothetical protein